MNNKIFTIRDIEVFEINEINTDSDFYHTIMRERRLVA